MESMQTLAAGDERPRRMTIDEWIALDEDEPGEWVDGHIEEEEVADYVHDVIVAWFIKVALGLWLDTQPDGLVAASDARFVLSPRRGRKPDATVFLPGSRRPPARGAVRVPPDIAVEVISPSPRDVRRDRLAKMDEYAAFGIRFYWLVDPEARTFEIYELHDGLYRRDVGAEGGVVHPVPGCPGLSLDLAKLWAEVDKLYPASAAEGGEATAAAPEEASPVEPSDAPDMTSDKPPTT